MSFKVTILGSGSAVPTKRRFPTSQFVECTGRNILIDCGEGTQIQIRKFGIKFQRINRILISHLHGDHYFGLVGLLSTMHLMGRTQPIDIYGPVGLKDIIEIQLNAAGSRLSFDVDIVELQPNSSGILFEDEKIKIQYFPLHHKIPTSGFRIDQQPKERKLLVEKAQSDGVKIEFYHRLKKGENVIDENGREILFTDYTEPSSAPKSYAYCSDTSFSEKIIPFIKGVDYLYHEATFTEKYIERAHVTKHSTAKEAATIAKMANVGELLMGHLSARYVDGNEHQNEAQTIFENARYVNDGDEIVIAR